MDRIASAALTAGREPGEISLLAASKSQNVDAIRSAVAAGVTLIGENYVQEAAAKKKQLPGSAQWHMIGHLQRNKAKAALDIFDLIESLDSLSLAHELNEEGVKRNKTIRAFVEVNLGGEESKSGIAKNHVAALLAEVGALSHIRVEGLMTVPPFRENLEEVRPYFRDLRQLRDSLAALRLPNVELKELSMGMTHDYTVAVEEGATIVRIGTALFGPRKT